MFDYHIWKHQFKPKEVKWEKVQIEKHHDHEVDISEPIHYTKSN